MIYHIVAKDTDSDTYRHRWRHKRTQTRIQTHIQTHAEISTDTDIYINTDTNADTNPRPNADTDTRTNAGTYVRTTMHYIKLKSSYAFTVVQSQLYHKHSYSHTRDVTYMWIMCKDISRSIFCHYIQ